MSYAPPTIPSSSSSGPDLVTALEQAAIDATVTALKAATNTWTGVNTFRAAGAIRSEAAATQDAVILAGRAGGTSSHAVTISPTTLTASRSLTLADGDTVLAAGTVLVNGGAGGTPSSLTLTNATGLPAASLLAGTLGAGSYTVRAAATQDGIILAGRAGGTSDWAATITPPTLSGNVTITLPSATSTLATLGANTFTGVQILSVAGADGAPALRVSGAWNVTTASDMAQVLIDNGGTPFSGDAAGTGFGINAPSGFTGHLFDFRVNNANALHYDASISSLILRNNVGFRTWVSGGLTIVDSAGGNLYTFYGGEIGFHYPTASGLRLGSGGGAGNANTTWLGHDGVVNVVAIRPYLATDPAQKLRVYGTWTDASNYTRLALNTTSTTAELAAETAGTGADNIDLALTPAGTGKVSVTQVLGAELAATTAANYTYTPGTPGWSATDGPLVFTRTASGSDLTIVQTTMTVTAGTTYKVAWVAGGTCVGTVQVSIGGTPGLTRTHVTGTTYTEYITANTTTALTFTVAATTTGTISGISVKVANSTIKSSDATGPLLIDSNLVPSKRLILPMGEVGYFNTTGATITISGTSDGSTNMVVVDPATTLSEMPYEFDMSANGRLRYKGETSRCFHCAITVSGTPATPSDILVFGMAKNGTVQAASKVVGSASGTQFSALHCMVHLDTDDYIELYIGNTTAARNFTVKSLNIFTMGM